MDPDDAAYRKDVRNMSLVLAAMVITIFAALFLPPFVAPSHNVYQPAVSLDSPYGFTLHLTLNSTAVPAGGAVLLTGWLNSTSSAIENTTASSSWGFPPSDLWGRACTSGWPIGLGVMRGHYTQDNYTLGTLVGLTHPLVSCPVQLATPQYFLFEARSSRALVSIAGVPTVWLIQSSLSVPAQPTGSLPLAGQLQPGVYTAVLADEWGDVLTTNFQVA